MVKSIDAYTSEYMNDYGFESEMVFYRRKLVLERLQFFSPKNIIEVGCGSELQSSYYASKGFSWDSWTIIEPSKEFAEIAISKNMKNTKVINDYFENAIDQIDENPDFIICSGLLHEVPDSGKLLSSIYKAMSSETVAHINVPNAYSFHRRLAFEMGILDQVTTLSDRNISLQQPRVYELESLIKEVESHGLKITAQGGHFVKPFTHSQMESVCKVLERNVLDGLYELGKSNPEWASEIYVDVKT